jgi:hypothetical protein
VKASSVTSTKVSVHISETELVALVRSAGIHVPADTAVDCYAAPFDTEFDPDGGGIIVEWTQEHDAPKQG